MVRDQKGQELAIRICDHYDKVAHGNRKLTYEYFSKKEGVSISTLCTILNKYEETGTAIYTKSKGRPPKVMTPQVIEQVARAYQEDPSVSENTLSKRFNITKSTINKIKKKAAKINLQKYQEAHGLANAGSTSFNLDLGSPDIGPGSPAQVSPKYIEVNCTICCQNIDNYENPQDRDIPTSSTDIISQTICKLFGIQDDFKSLTSASSYCTNCSSQILKIQKILQKLDEAKLQLEKIIIKNAAGTSGDFILNQNSTEIARNEIIKRMKPTVNPEAAAVKLEDNENSSNEVFDPPDWNLPYEDNYIEKTEESQENQSNSDPNEAEQFYFYLKTPVLKLSKLSQSLVNQLTQKNVDLKAIQNEIDLHIEKDHENQIINKSVKSPIVNIKMKILCAKCGKSYNHKKNLKRHYIEKHGNAYEYSSRKQLSKDGDNDNSNSISGRKVRSHLCHLCSRSFTALFTLRLHLKSHSRETFKCPVPNCIKVFKSNAALQDHLNSHNNIKVHKCSEDHCDSIFSTKKQLASHETLHRKLKGTYKCTICPASFGFAKNLLSHKKAVHNYIESSEIICEICAKVFYRKKSYNKHKYSVHKSSRKLFNFEKKQCPICNGWFKNGSNFERHKNIHSQLALTDHILPTEMKEQEIVT